MRDYIVKVKSYISEYFDSEIYCMKQFDIENVAGLH